MIWVLRWIVEFSPRDVYSLGFWTRNTKPHCWTETVPAICHTWLFTLFDFYCLTMHGFQYFQTIQTLLIKKYILNSTKMFHLYCSLAKRVQGPRVNFITIKI